MAEALERGDVTASLAERGFMVLPPVDPAAAAALLTRVKSARVFGPTLFLSEAEFDADPQYRGVNPRPGRNLAEAFEDGLAFVEANAGVTGALTELLSQGYECLTRKFVCGVPQAWVPDWLRARIAGNPVNNLGAYVRPEFRDITYFYGIDFHQDLIDYPEREADFVTLYVYLHPVGRQDAPLFLLENSHRLAGTVFPHDLTPAGEGEWLYRDGRGGETRVSQHLLVGDTGYAAVWHACTLHGTQPDAADHERISLRYILAKAPGSPPAGIDQVNSRLHGPLSLEATRRDLAADGSAQIKANSVNSAMG
ncbi:MAG: hypothetical protein JWM33_55 [Caulobacteraceae bacterium]|nr:hypothetical protein [Caulobacteraceae bacterium]